MKPRKTRSDSAGVALLARIESHLADFRRRALRRGDEEGFRDFDSAIEIIRLQSRSLRFEQAQAARQRRETAATARLAQELREAA